MLLAAGLTVACTRKAPAPAPEAGLVQLYCDLALLAGDAGQPPPDSARAAIFTAYGTTQAAFEAALQPYRDDPRGWVRFFQAVLDTLQERIGTPPPPTGFVRPGQGSRDRPQPPGG